MENHTHCMISRHRGSQALLVISWGGRIARPCCLDGVEDPEPEQIKIGSAIHDSVGECIGLYVAQYV
jgi:hypothetical protein